jgi:hypothetical protein
MQTSMDLSMLLLGLFLVITRPEKTDVWIFGLHMDHLILEFNLDLLL